MKDGEIAQTQTPIRCTNYAHCDLHGMKTLLDCGNPGQSVFQCGAYSDGTAEKQARASTLIAYFGPRIGHFDSRDLGGRL